MTSAETFTSGFSGTTTSNESGTLNGTTLTVTNSGAGGGTSVSASNESYTASHYSSGGNASLVNNAGAIIGGYPVSIFVTADQTASVINSGEIDGNITAMGYGFSVTSVESDHYNTSSTTTSSDQWTTITGNLDRRQHVVLLQSDIAPHGQLFGCLERRLQRCVGEQCGQRRGHADQCVRRVDHGQCDGVRALWRQPGQFRHDRRRHHLGRRDRPGNPGAEHRRQCVLHGLRQFQRHVRKLRYSQCRAGSCSDGNLTSTYSNVGGQQTSYSSFEAQQS